MTPQAVMIFAAGLGTRMGALTRDRPKPLIEVAGRPLIDHALALAHAAGIPRIVVNIHAHAGQLQAHLARVAPDALISHEPELLETGGGLKQALPLLGPGPVFAMNADVVWRGPNPLQALAAGWRPGTGALLMLVPREDARGHAGPGDFFRDARGRLRRRGDAERADFVYAGAQIIDPEALAAFPAAAFSLNPVWAGFIAEGRLEGRVHAGGWVDVGRPEGIALAEAELAR
jgi:MurNAc alpha-1-phosphate uridylyltransferase